MIRLLIITLLLKLLVSPEAVKVLKDVRRLVVRPNRPQVIPGEILPKAGKDDLVVPPKGELRGEGGDLLWTELCLAGQRPRQRPGPPVLVSGGRRLVGKGADEQEDNLNAQRDEDDN